MEAHLTVDKGRIADVRFYGDFFSTEDPEVLAGQMKGISYDKESVRSALQNMDISRFFTGLDAETLTSILLDGTEL